VLNADVLNCHITLYGLIIIIIIVVSDCSHLHHQFDRVALRPGSNIKQKHFGFTRETVVCNVLIAQVGRKTVPKHVAWRQAKLLSPNVLCVRGTAHDLSVEERSRRRWPSETRCMSSARYGGAWPDKDEKTKHAC